MKLSLDLSKGLKGLDENSTQIAHLSSFFNRIFARYLNLIPLTGDKPMILLPVAADNPLHKYRVVYAHIQVKPIQAC